MAKHSFFGPQADTHNLRWFVTGLFNLFGFCFFCHGLVLPLPETYFPNVPQELHPPVLQPPTVCRTGKSEVIWASGERTDAF
jgi:hypothetical protein